MELRKLRKSIFKFRLKHCLRGHQGYNRVLLQLFGLPGHGKSSLVNSIAYVLHDHETFYEFADAQSSDGGNTIIRNAYELTKNLTIVDNRGYEMTDNFQKAEIYTQLGNFLPLNEEVEWNQNYSTIMERLVDSEMDPNYTDFIVPVLVFSCKFYLPEELQHDVKMFMSNCVSMTGVVPIVVLTNKTSGDYIEMENMFKLMGAEIVISVENYTTENHLKTLGRSRDFLMFLDGAIGQVKYRMEKKRDPRKERNHRMKFVLQYVRDIDQMENENAGAVINHVTFDIEEE